MNPFEPHHCFITLNPALDLFYQSLHTPTPNEICFADSLRMLPGGKGINAAMAFRKAFPVARVTSIQSGGTSFDPFFREQLQQFGIEALFLPGLGQMRINTHVFSEQGKRMTKINAPGVPISPSVLEALCANLSRIRPAFLLLCGSLPPGLPPDSYKRLVAWGKAHQSTVWLDTRGTPLAEALKAEPAGVKINADELREIAPECSTNHPDSLVQKAREWHTTLCITDGPQSVWVADAHGARSYTPPPLGELPR
ncbi:MAG: PfkB family carbohydrate kinase, partial [Candidatus Sumerlaeia bacterium]|nr:PfkB family carbohydrate kinase [Candidatus Sumerlaeia bacterium]